MEALIFLTYLAVILLLGIISTLISRKIKIPNILFLIFVGIALNKIKYKGAPLIEFPGVFLTSIGILALVLIIFDSSSRFKLKEFDQLSLKALKLTIIFLILNLVVLTFSTVFIFGLKINIYHILLGALFAALMSGTDPAAVLTMLGQTKNKLLELLEIESLINTPIIVLLPFIVLDLMGGIKVGSITATTFFDQMFPFLQDILLRLIAGIGAGILVGIILFKVMRRKYSETLSPLAIITAALLTYVLAENLKGNGVLAVTTLGLFFGNVYVKQKIQLKEFSAMFANSLEILVFVLVGLIVNVPFNYGFFMKSFSLFVIYLLVRFLSVQISFRKSTFTFKEKIFMTLNVQKGIAVAAVVFTLSLLNIEGITTILHLTLMFMIYSIILSTIIIRLSQYFIKADVKTE
jgi:cell volume regulation protein A